MFDLEKAPGKWQKALQWVVQCKWSKPLKDALLYGMAHKILDKSAAVQVAHGFVKYMRFVAAECPSSGKEHEKVGGLYAHAHLFHAAQFSYAQFIAQLPCAIYFCAISMLNSHAQAITESFGDPLLYDTRIWSGVEELASLIQTPWFKGSGRGLRNAGAMGGFFAKLSG